MRCLPASKEEGDWRRREIYQRYTEMAFYVVVMHAWTEIGYPRGLAGKPEDQGG